MNWRETAFYLSLFGALIALLVVGIVGIVGGLTP